MNRAASQTVCLGCRWVAVARARGRHYACRAAVKISGTSASSAQQHSVGAATFSKITLDQHHEIKEGKSSVTKTEGEMGI